MRYSLKRILLGRTLKSEDLKDEKFDVFWGLPILASDAMSSVAYASEEILWVLIPILGISSYKYMFLAALTIVFLLFLLVFSYKQTIDNYPNGGGAYIVAKENLGTIPGLVAGASLCVDYILTVAVSTSAGTAAITSAIPSLLQYKVIITIVLIVFLTIGNLRGIRESSKIFGAPTYLFLLSVIIMIFTGLVKHFIFDVQPEAIYIIPNITGDISIFLFLKAFSGGCTALTGVEAVSNGIPSFKEPSQKNAKKVLFLLAGIVLFMFGGISYLATIYHAVPNSNETVISQIATQIFIDGRLNFMYYVIQAMTALILILAANTAFNGFPLLLALIAKDGYAPKQFTKRGKRLSFSNGIILLSIAAGILVWKFNGDTHLLLPLYAVGVFISFTLSQVGMFTKWTRSKGQGWVHKACINGVGALFTFGTVIIIGITKFSHGAWIVCILIPILVFIMFRIKRHYNRIAEQLRLSIDERPKTFDEATQRRLVIVPIESLNKSFLKALNYARTISDDIIVFHISVDEEATEKLKKKWEGYNTGIPLVVKKSPYRHLINPLVKFIEFQELKCHPRDIITVVLTQFVVQHWWENMLHNQTTLFIRSLLLKRRNIAVVTIPYIIQK